MKEITEKEAAEGFYGIVLQNVQKAWPEMYEELKKLFGKEYTFEIEDEDNAKIHLAMAVIALELGALKQLFPDQAARIYRKTLDLINPPADREYIRKKIELYKEKFDEYMDQYSKNPHYVPAEPGAQLLHDWFGENIDKLYLQKFKEHKIINPVIAGAVNSMVVLVTGTGLWKNIKNNFIITDG